MDSDVVNLCEKSGAVCEKEDNKILIKLLFINRLCEIRIPSMEIVYLESQEELPIWAQILILHYLSRSESVPLSGRLINFRQIPGGNSYYPVFRERTLVPLAQNFGSNPELLIDVARPLGGQKLVQGDAGVIIYAFPKVPLIFIVWKGDRELSSTANILFDSTITHHLSTEDVVILCQMLVNMLGKQAMSLKRLI